MAGGSVDAHLLEILRSSVWRRLAKTPVFRLKNAAEASGRLVDTESAYRPTPKPPSDMGPPRAGSVLFTLATVCLLPVWVVLYLTIFSQDEEKEKED